MGLKEAELARLLSLAVRGVKEEGRCGPASPATAPRPKAARTKSTATRPSQASPPPAPVCPFFKTRGNWE